MSELIAWLAALILAVGTIWAISNDYQQKQARTIAQYEKDVREGKTTGAMMARKGFLELEKLTKPNLQAAIEFAQDEEQGQTSTKESGDDNDADKKSDVT